MILEQDDPRWSDFVQNCPEALPFHHPTWLGLLADCYRYRPFVLAATDSVGRIAAGLPVLDVSHPFTGQRWVSLPFTDYCPVLTDRKVTEDLIDVFIREVKLRKLNRFEVRTSLPNQDQLYTYSSGVRHTLALSTNLSVVYEQLSKMHQRNIRKAERDGVKIERGCSSSDIKTFYQLHLITRRRLGVPIQPYRFFSLLGHHVLERGLGFILSAHVNHVPAAAAVFLAWNGVLVYKYGASDLQFREYRPNNLLFWEAIRWGCEKGYHTLDWGRTDWKDEGLRQFKNGWGTVEEPLMYSELGGRLPKPSSGRLQRAVGVLIRHSPKFVCQALGECLYRYAA